MTQKQSYSQNVRTFGLYQMCYNNLTQRLIKKISHYFFFKVIMRVVVAQLSYKLNFSKLLNVFSFLSTI